MPRETLTSSRYNNDCIMKGVAKNFIKIRKDASVEKTLTTGNKMLDHIVQSKVSSKIPYLGHAIKAINIPPQVGAHIAHGINAYNESCSNR